MKNALLTTILLCLLTISNVFSQGKVKFGDVSVEELEATTYEFDKEAPAVVLHEDKFTRYDFNSRGLYVINDYTIRIKIFTNDGLEYANGAISRYMGRTAADRETISGLTGFTYNLENGKIVKTKLSKEHIFEEEVSEYVTRTKFAMPKVIPGSVIEYKYSLQSPHYGQLDDFVFQREIPVKYSKCTLRILEYFNFNKEVRGSERIEHTSNRINEMFHIGEGRLTCNSEELVFEVNNIPGIKNEKYVWCMRDYLTKVTFELRGITIPGSLYKTFTNTWENVDEELLKNDRFGKQFNHKLFGDEIKKLLTPEMNETDKVRAIHNLVRSKVKFDGNNTLWAKSPKNALKNGTGSSAEINALLLSALKEAGFNPYPVVMSLRSRGRIPISHPTMDYLNYYIVCVNIDDKPVYMDASSKYGDLSVLHPDCMTDFARNLGSGNRSEWINISDINKSSERTLVNASFNEEGLFTGDCLKEYSNQSAFSFRQNYASKKDEQEYIDELQSANNIQIADFKIANLEETDKRVTMSYSFVKNDISLQDDFIYLNPLVFPIFTESPFKAENRTLPIEFPYSYKEQIVVNIKLPENYKMEDYPKTGKVSLENKDAEFVYIIQYNEPLHQISVNLNFSLNRIIYNTADYTILRDFFNHITTQNTALVTLKRNV